MFAYYITCGSEKEAEEISEKLLKKKLIACANIFPVRSLYLSKGGIEKGDEHVIIAKTRRDDIDADIKNLHSYDVPCIMRMPVGFNKEYERWLRGEDG